MQCCIKFKGSENNEFIYIKFPELFDSYGTVFISFGFQPTKGRGFIYYSAVSAAVLTQMLFYGSRKNGPKCLLIRVTCEI